MILLLSEFVMMIVSLHSCDPPTSTLCLARVQGLEWVWRGHSIVSQRVWVWWSCVLLYTSPTSPVLLNFHSTSVSPLLMELQVCLHWSSRVLHIHCAYMYKHASGILLIVSNTMILLQLTQRTMGNWI